MIRKSHEERDIIIISKIIEEDIRKNGKMNFSLSGSEYRW